jgi:hypothetical protein
MFRQMDLKVLYIYIYIFVMKCQRDIPREKWKRKKEIDLEKWKLRSWVRSRDSLEARGMHSALEPIKPHTTRPQSTERWHHDRYTFVLW